MSNFLIFTITFGFVWLAMALIPYLTRKTDLFGITIPVAIYDRSDFRAMRKQYALILLGFGIICFLGLSACFFFLTDQLLATSFIIMLFLYLISSFLLYLPFHFKAKKVKEEEAWQETYAQKTMIDLHFRQEKLTFSNWFFLIPISFILANAVLLALFYDRLPAEIPIHYGLNGEVTYAAASARTIFMPLAIQCFLVLLFLGINIIIRQAKQQTDAGQPDQSKRQNILFRRSWSGWIIVTATLLAALFFYLQLNLIFDPLQRFMPLILLVVVGFICLSVLFLVLKTGQGGSRIQMDNKESQHVMNSDDDRYWKLGQFYVNKADPSIFVEKRFGIGWTNNWGHPFSWLLLILLFAIILLIILLFT